MEIIEVRSSDVRAFEVSEFARRRWRGNCVTPPREAAESLERSTRAHEDEAIAIAEALEARSRVRS